MQKHYKNTVIIFLTFKDNNDRLFVVFIDGLTPCPRQTTTFIPFFLLKTTKNIPDSEIKEVIKYTEAKQRKKLKGSENNNFPFLRRIFRPYLTDLHSQNPLRSVGYACGFVQVRSDKYGLNLFAKKGSYYFLNPKKPG